MGQNYFLNSHLHFQSSFLKLLCGEQPSLTGKIFKGHRCAFWCNCTLAQFWCRTLGQNYFLNSHLHFQSSFQKLLCGEQPNLTGKIFRGSRCAFWDKCTLRGVILRGPKCAFWDNCTLAHFCCSTIGQYCFTFNT